MSNKNIKIVEAPKAQDDLESRVYNLFGPDKKPFTPTPLSILPFTESRKISAILSNERSNDDDAVEVIQILDPSWTEEELSKLSAEEFQHLAMRAVLEHGRQKSATFSR